jgi:glyoxylase-like metal-dependent hydrolase (beta-lactamase superfamily II)
MSRMTKVRSMLAAAAVVACALPAVAQQPSGQPGQPQGQPPAPPPINMKQLTSDVWAGLGGAGGNSTIIIGKTGVIVVDAKTSEAGAKDLLAEIAKITPKPVTTAIITHSDGDHVNGLAAFPAGVKIIAHENNKKEQEAALAAGGRGAPPADRLPNQVVTKNKETMTIDGVKLELYHFGPAHTSGDLIVYLPDLKIVSTGDIVVTNRADDNPNVHFEKNGSTAGWLANVKGMIGLNSDTYITGHGDIVTKADLQRKFDATQARRDKIAAMVKEGKTLDEIKAALPDAPNPGAAARGAGGPGGGAPGGAPGGGRAGGAPGGGGGGGRGGPPALTFVETAYQELTKK